MDDQESILYEVEPGGIAIITLNRPDHLNAMNRSTAAELVEVLDQADQNPEVRVIILTGAGRAFCAGADLSSGASAFAPNTSSSGDVPTERDWGGVLALRIFELTKPIIAAINGASVGIGATMSLPCDVRIASTNSKFGFVFARRGIVTDGCASWFLPRLVGISTALRWCLSGDIFDAYAALDAGLISSIHEPDELMSAARSLAVDFSSQTAPVAASLTRQLLWHGLTELHPMGSHRVESEILSVIAAGKDAQEGVSSFLEKRPANFSSVVPNDLPKDWPFWNEIEF